MVGKPLHLTPANLYRGVPQVSVSLCWDRVALVCAGCRSCIDAESTVNAAELVRQELVLPVSKLWLSMAQCSVPNTSTPQQRV